jgi:hypothetical protein
MKRQRFREILLSLGLLCAPAFLMSNSPAPSSTPVGTVDTAYASSLHIDAVGNPTFTLQDQRLTSSFTAKITNNGQEYLNSVTIRAGVRETNSQVVFYQSGTMSSNLPAGKTLLLPCTMSGTVSATGSLTPSFTLHNLSITEAKAIDTYVYSSADSDPKITEVTPTYTLEAFYPSSRMNKYSADISFKKEKIDSNYLGYFFVDIQKDGVAVSSFSYDLAYYSSLSKDMCHGSFLIDSTIDIKTVTAVVYGIPCAQVRYPIVNALGHLLLALLIIIPCLLFLAAVIVAIVLAVYFHNKNKKTLP